MQPAHPLRSIDYFIATGFFSGLSRVMPGTAGTAVCAILLFLIERIQFFSHPLVELLTAVFITTVGVFVTARLLRAGVFGEDSGDPQVIVIDEFAGFAVALLGCGTSWQEFLAAFVLFRFFDMTKIPPISTAEKLPGAYGIIADDIIAGIFAALVLYFLVPAF